ncbi:MAG: beta-ketoacyl synthase N-terminal-like domain-containing protein, partial [Candidatus Methylacidiphilales bacterium]
MSTAPESSVSPVHQPRAIAIVAWSGQFPGAANPGEFWQNLVAGKDASLDRAPEGRWYLDPESILATESAQPDKVASRRAYFLNPTTEVIAGEENLDPLCRLTLSVGRAAWAEAKSPLPGDPSRAGIILANIALPTDTVSDLARAAAEPLVRHAIAESLGIAADVTHTEAAGSAQTQVHPSARCVTGLPAGLLASALGIRGGAYTLDAACASSLYAIELASLELEAGRADVMVTGGVSRPDSLYTQMGFSQLRALSPSGRCSPFDANADGLMVGEGAAIFVLKRLEDAVAAGDTIHAVIRGIGLSNDVGGKLLAPDSEGQLRAMHIAYGQAGWSANAVDLIECHGTGTPVGDATELRSLRAMWEQSGAAHQKGQCALGSVKANVGHLLTGAGAAALSKVLLALQHRTIPPQPNFRASSPDSPLTGSPFFVPTTAREWNLRDDKTPRRAAISGFGFGGINAHLLLEEWVTAKAAELPRIDRVIEEPERIAIVGMEATFGKLSSLREFQTAHFHAESVLQSVPESRERSAGTWNVTDALQGLIRQAAESPRGAFLPELQLRAGEFRIPPVELKDILPQQLLMLRVAKAALADALGAKGADRAARPRAGVIVGMSLDLGTTNFHLRWAAEDLVRDALRRLRVTLPDEDLIALIHAVREALSPALSASRTLGALGGIIASRIARELDFGGPSFTISSEESSALRAVEVATRFLQTGRLDLAVAGAIDLPLDWRNVFAHQIGRTSHSLGDGAGAVVLKRLSDAQRDGDRVYAVLRGIGGSNGHNVTAESFPGFASSADALPYAIRSAQKTSVSSHGPGALGYWELSGQSHADFSSEAIETQSLTPGSSSQPCALGTSRNVIGDCGAAQGMVSFLRAALALHTRTLPSQLPPSARGADQETPLHLNGLDSDKWHLPSRSLPWLRDRSNGPRLAAVNSLSSDGTCMHAVLEEAGEPFGQSRFVPLSPASSSATAREALFAFEAENVAGLRAKALELKEWAQLAVTDLGKAGSPSLPDLAAQWFTRQQSNNVSGTGSAQRFAILAGTVAELKRRAGDAAVLLGSGRAHSVLDGRNGLFFSPEPMAAQGQTAFVFPGSCNHYLGMGLGYAARFPQVLERLDAENQRLASQSMPRWLAPWRLDWPADWEAQSNAALLEDQHRMIFGQVTHGVVVNDVLRLFLPQPDAVIGYSLGETASLFASRTWRGRDELLRRMESTDLFRSQLGGNYEAARRYLNWPADAPLDWRAAVVNRPAEAVRAVLDGDAGAGGDNARRPFPAVFLLIVNAPEECVVGGHWPDVERAVAEMGGRAWPLSGISIAHCAVVEEVADAYRDLHKLPVTPPAGMRIYSGNAAKSYEPTTDNCANSVLGHALYGFDYPGVIRQAYADGIRIFVEPGPQGSCTRAIGRILRGQPHVALTACVRGQDDVASLLRVLGRLYVEGVPVNFTELYKDGFAQSTAAGAGTGTGDERKVAAALPAVGAPVITVPIELPGLKLPKFHSVTPPRSAPSPSTESAPYLPKVPDAPHAPELPHLTEAEDLPHVPAFSPYRPAPALPPGRVQVPELVPSAYQETEYQPATSILSVMPAFTEPAANVETAMGFHLREVMGGAERATLQLSQATGQAHASFLALSQTAGGAMSSAIEFQLRLLENAGAGIVTPSSAAPETAHGYSHSEAPSAQTYEYEAPHYQVQEFQDAPPQPQPWQTQDQPCYQPETAPEEVAIDPMQPPRSLNRAACLEFAIGSIGRVLGPLFAEADHVPNRVRLPDEPLMLVDRITDIRGEPLSLGSGTVVTEHDVHAGAWYLDAGCAPVCISVEAGQADLFLSGFLGIDLATRGERRYRLLDAKIGFHRQLPRAGETIRYEIHIDKFIQQGSTWLFFFRFDGFIGTEPLLTMREGCAGFFSQQQLANSAGIVLSPEEAKPPRSCLPADWITLAPEPSATETYDASALDALRRSDLVAAFGPAFVGLKLRKTSPLPGGRMTLIHRITGMDPKGGRYGLGSIAAEADVRPDDWYLTCHFIDDMVMPGTLMYECCLHALRVYLMRLGWIGEEGRVTFEPVPGRASKLRCRGQVLQSTRVVRYEIELKEIGYGKEPGGSYEEPYAIADAFMYADGKRIVFMSDMSLRLRGLSRTGLEALWAGRGAAHAPAKVQAPPTGTYGVPSPDNSPAVFTESQILHYAVGQPSLGFGDPYRIFDEGKGRVLARLPGPPYLFVDRIAQTHGAKAWQLGGGSWIEAQYDVPLDAWYFWANRQKSMALSVLLEIALQPCGWMAAFMGSALRSPDLDLSFRNLGGTATQYAEIFPGSGELTTQVRLTSFSEAGGMMIQKYDMCV